MGPRHVRVLGGVFCEPHFLPDWPPGWRCWAAAAAGAKDAKTFMGFRLLDLENQSVKWRTPTFGKSAVVTYAFATGPVSTPARAIARRCFPRPAPTSLRRSAPASSAARSLPPSACGRRSPTSPSASPPIPASAGILIGAQAQPLGRAFTNVALKQGTGEQEGHRPLAHLPQPEAAVEDRLRRPSRRLRPALHPCA